MRCARSSRREMEAGALGIGSSLIYAPAFYATTEELIELCKVAAQYQGKYISHIRSEGNRLIEAVEELIRISREAKIPAEIYHLKAAGEANWPKMRPGHRPGRGRRGASGLHDHRRHVHLHGGRDRPRRGRCRRGRSTAATRRLQAPARSRDAPQDRRGHAHAVQRVGEPLPGGGFAGARPARRVQVGRAEAARPARRSPRSAKSRGKDPVDTIMDLVLEDRSQRRDGLLHDVGREPHASRSSCRGCRSGPTRRRWRPKPPSLESSTHPARLRQLRARARQIRARREGR